MNVTMGFVRAVANSLILSVCIYVESTEIDPYFIEFYRLFRNKTLLLSTSVTQTKFTTCLRYAS